MIWAGTRIDNFLKVVNSTLRLATIIWCEKTDSSHLSLLTLSPSHFSPFYLRRNAPIGFFFPQNQSMTGKCFMADVFDTFAVAMSVKVSHLSKIFETQRAVDDVSFEAHKGEVLGFLGPNGAGKTTTMKIITGYLPQTSGKVEVCGFDVSENPGIPRPCRVPARTQPALPRYVCARVPGIYRRCTPCAQSRSANSGNGPCPGRRSAPPA